MAWLVQARRALAANTTTFALLPIDEAVRADDCLAALKSDGNTAEPPDADHAPPGEGATPAFAISTAR